MSKYWHYYLEKETNVPIRVLAGKAIPRMNSPLSFCVNEFNGEKWIMPPFPEIGAKNLFFNFIHLSRIRCEKI